MKNEKLKILPLSKPHHPSKDELIEKALWNIDMALRLLNQALKTRK